MFAYYWLPAYFFSNQLSWHYQKRSTSTVSHYSQYLFYAKISMFILPLYFGFMYFSRLSYPIFANEDNIDFTISLMLCVLLQVYLIFSVLYIIAFALGIALFYGLRRQKVIRHVLMATIMAMLSTHAFKSVSTYISATFYSGNSPVKPLFLSFPDRSSDLFFTGLATGYYPFGFPFFEIFLLALFCCLWEGVTNWLSTIDRMERAKGAEEG